MTAYKKVDPDFAEEQRKLYCYSYGVEEQWKTKYGDICCQFEEVGEHGKMFSLRCNGMYDAVINAVKDTDRIIDEAKRFREQLAGDV